ncbi:MAG: hypothetical protein MK210_16580 [Dehalococcoidia bacterium]|jgi:hypothetical protein|nr:hypothetical protein [Dehalococcoidia bacterium]
MTTLRQGPSDFRFTAFDFDPIKYDAMMSLLDTVKDRLKGISELRNVRVVRTLENRMMVMAGYGSKKAMEAGTEAHSSIFADFAGYITDTPIVLGGEVVGRVNGEIPRDDIKYMRFVRAIIDPSKYDAMMSVVNGGVLDKYKDVPGLSRLLLVRVNETHMIAASGYVSKEAADAARENTDASLASVSEYMTAEPLIRQGNLVWLYQYNL